MATTFLSQKTLSSYDSWNKKFPKSEVDFKTLQYHSSLKKMFKNLFNDERIKRTQSGLSDAIKVSDNVIMYPPPDLLFNAFSLTSLDKTKVVFLGQDPYFDTDQAMGLSFSVPHDKDIPSSLKNIYKNLENNGHLKFKPKHGNLEFWALQGCLMLNTSLTVLHGDANKNCHQNIWRWFTDKIIKYISDTKDKVIFVLWGGNALEKINLIDLDKHEVIISSHPSGLSASKPLKSHPAFNEYDHFGKINAMLKKWEMSEIVWQP